MGGKGKGKGYGGKGGKSARRVEVEEDNDNVQIEDRDMDMKDVESTDAEDTFGSNNNNNNNNFIKTPPFQTPQLPDESPLPSMSSPPLPKIARAQTDSDLLHDMDDQTITSESDSSYQVQSKKATGKKKSAAAAAAGNRRKGSKYQDDRKKHRRNEEEQPKVHYVGPNVFWSAMDPYFRVLAEGDLEHITPKNEEFYTSYFVIPPRGQHYTDVWVTEDAERLNRQPQRQQRLTQSQSIDNLDEMGQERCDAPDPFLGDLSMRLLSILVEENIVSTSGHQNGLGKAGGSNSGGSGGKSSILLSGEVPSSSYNVATQHSLEERIRVELMSLGLYDDFPLPSNEKEDDQICLELRYLQNQLRDYINTNNQLKSQTYATCKTILTKQDHHKKRKQFQATVEKNYQKLMKRDRKKKKLKTT
eukprot:gene14966-17695_t